MHKLHWPLLLLATCLFVGVSSIRDTELIGWSESPSTKRLPPRRNQQNPDQISAPANESGTGARPAPHKVQGVQVLSWSPRIVLYRGFLTDEETDHIIEVASPELHPSKVVALGGNPEPSDVRTSYGTFLQRYQDPIIEGVEKKVSTWTMIPPDHGESMQVLRYEHGQEYKPHHDYIFHDSGNDNGGNRVCTVLMYLADVEEGGETIFPDVPVPSWQTREAGYSECAMQGMAVKARKGDAVAFWSMGLDGSVDPKALHGSCPVIKGMKYAATKWLHMGNYSVGESDAVRLIPIMYGTRAPPPQPAWCENEEGECFGWAMVGECERNPFFMIGTPEFPGKCPLACNRCDVLGDPATRPKPKRLEDLPDSGEDSEGDATVSWKRTKKFDRNQIESLHDVAKVWEEEEGSVEFIDRLKKEAHLKLKLGEQPDLN